MPPVQPGTCPAPCGGSLLPWRGTLICERCGITPVPPITLTDARRHELACAEFLERYPAPSLTTPPSDVWNHKFAVAFFNAARRRRMEIEAGA